MAYGADTLYTVLQEHRLEDHTASPVRCLMLLVYRDIVT